MSATNKNNRRSLNAAHSKDIGGTDNADSIKVICRFRPPASNAKRESLGSSVKSSKDKVPVAQSADAKIDSFRLNEERSEVELTSDFADGKLFTFDKVFGIDSTQLEVFKEVSGVVKSVMDGFNGTVMAYGQTSAGKSWTMEGSSIWDSDNQGIIPRCIDGLFEEINNSNSDIQFNLTISFFEIYCEKVRDLLNPASYNLKIRETKNDGFIVQDISEVSCTDRESVLRVIEMGKTNRASAPTLMNAESSRSHSIVSILVSQRHSITGRNRTGKMFLVDLAGSEKVGKTGASGMRLEEAKNINSSLTTLGMVINALCDHTPHVPYRDSKLTMILMDALGGNSKTTLIICCNPEMKHTAETMTTLRFGERAKRIKTNAKINEELSAQELKALLEKAKREIVMLKKKLLQAMNGTLPPGTAIETNLDDDVGEREGTPMVGGDFQSSASAASDALLQANSDEILSLNARIVSLEEELEVEKTRYKDELENSLLFRSEVDALKNTIEELEGKLLKASLEAKRSVANLNALTAEANTLPTVKEGNENEEEDEDEEEAAAVVDPAAVLEEQQQVKKEVVEDEEDVNVCNPDTQQQQVLETLPPHVEDKAAAASAAASAAAAAGEEDAALLQLSAEELAHSHQLARDMLALSEHSNNLRSALEGEIKGLERSNSDRLDDARTAQATAQSYAEKYIRLREEYESHVQRLMFKLTQEQQARTHVEDRLEDALHRLWRQNGSTGKAKGFFASFFSAANSMVNPHHNQQQQQQQRDRDHHGYGGTPERGGGGAGSGSSPAGQSEREANLSRSLELSQFRVSQLQSELEANKEAQSIVLETKESVMRQLARQNSQLTIERDALAKRSEELASTVDQLTNLLRSVQARKMNTLSVTPSTMHMMTPKGSFLVGGIRGGGGLNSARGGGGGAAGGPSSRFNFQAVDTATIREDESPAPVVKEFDEETDLSVTVDEE